MSSPESTIVRLASFGDEVGITHVHILAWQQSYAGIIPKPILDSLTATQPKRERWWGSVIRGETKTKVFVAQSKVDGIVGFCAVEPARDSEYSGCGEISAIYCLDDFKGKGIGSRLLRAGREALKNDGFSRHYLWVLENNPTISFYEKLGGVRQANRKQIDLGKPLIEVVYAFEN